MQTYLLRRKTYDMNLQRGHMREIYDPRKCYKKDKEQCSTNKIKCIKKLFRYTINMKL